MAKGNFKLAADMAYIAITGKTPKGDTCRKCDEAMRKMPTDWGGTVYVLSLDASNSYNNGNLSSAKHKYEQVLKAMQKHGLCCTDAPLYWINKCDANMCRSCGGAMGGILTKKCKSCGTLQN